MTETTNSRWQGTGVKDLPVIVPQIKEQKYPYVYNWGNNPVRAKCKGKQCRIIAAGKMNTVAVQFEDGFLMTTSRRALRKASR